MTPLLQVIQGAAPRIHTAAGRASATFRNAFEWADSLPDLEQRTASVINVLARYAYTSDVCWPSVSAIAAATRMDRETVARHLAILVQAGHISDTGERCGPRRNVVKWRLHWRRDSAAPRAAYTDDTPRAVAPPKAERPISVAPVAAPMPVIVMPAVAADADALVWPDLDLAMIAQDAEPAEPAPTEAPAVEVVAIPSPAGEAVDKSAVDKSAVEKAKRPVPTAVGLPVLPSPAPVPVAALDRLARIRAEAAARNATPPPPRLMH